jgi:phosphatidylinositol alpha-mannosyltransferase
VVRRDQRMRILLVSENYYPHFGGIAEHVHHMALELRRRRHEVGLLTGDFGTQSTIDPDWVTRVGRVHMISANRSRSPVVIGSHLSQNVSQTVARGYDIVHIHGPIAPFLPLLVLMHSRSLNIATFHAAHDCSLLHRAYGFWLRRYVRRRLHGRIAVSEAARRSAIKYLPGEYRIIPNAVDCQRFHPSVKPHPRFARARSVVLFIGRFDLRKGLLYLIDAFPLVVKQVPDATLVVVGPGDPAPLWERLPEAARGRLVFTGGVSPEEIPSYYTSCDVFCSPAISGESFGIILLEAMASGRPIVASDIDGYRDVVRQGKDGILVPPHNPQALADAIVSLLRDEKLRRRMGQSGLERSIEYSWPRVVDAIEDYYGEVVARWR